jgi:uncharacterized protein (TIGR02145 family)
MARGVCWSTSPNPTLSDSYTVDSSGLGSFTSNLVGLTDNTTYYVRAYATNSVGTAYGNAVSFTAIIPTCGTITDIDGNVYNTVVIGAQCWMRENLLVKRFANGTSIQLGSSVSYTTPYRYNPNNNASNVPTHGYLYNWPAVMNGAIGSSSNPSGVQGICPTGWHIPSDAEWIQLTDYVSSQSSYFCIADTNIAKALALTSGWNSSTDICVVGNNPSTNNATGFGTVPAGFQEERYYFDFGSYALFWSATEYSDTFAYYRVLGYNYATVKRNSYGKNGGFSVRCLRD